MTSHEPEASSALPAPALEERVLAPVPPAERSATLDVLRGSALFGVLWSNLNSSYGGPDWYLMPHFPITLEGSLAWVQQWLIQDRFYTLLAFLFGMGFGIQSRRAEAVGGNVRTTFCRRMLALLAFGVIHGTLIWSGDILTSYALVGLALVFYDALPSRRLLVAAAATYFLLPYATRWVVATLFPNPPARLPDLDVVRIYAHGTYAQIASLRVRSYVGWYTSYYLGNGIPGSLTLFVLGLWAARIGLVSNLSGYITRMRRAFWVALVCAAVGVFVLQNLGRWWPASTAPFTRLDPRFWSIRFVIQSSARILFYWGTAAAYAAALTLLVQHSRWARALRPLAAVGRMPLTTYLMQSIICTTLFYSYGFGWYGRFGLTGIFVITIAVFAFQIAASTFWVQRFRFGPAEWLWRSLSYGRAQPMRLALPFLPGVGSGQ